MVLLAVLLATSAMWLLFHVFTSAVCVFEVVDNAVQILLVSVGQVKELFLDFFLSDVDLSLIHLRVIIRVGVIWGRHNTQIHIAWRCCPCSLFVLYDLFVFVVQKTVVILIIILLEGNNIGIQFSSILWHFWNTNSRLASLFGFALQALFGCLLPDKLFGFFSGLLYFVIQFL